MTLESQETSQGCLYRSWIWLKGLAEKLVNKVYGIARDFKKLGEEDPRRIIHSLKVGLALSVVSLFYYFAFSYDNLGVSAMWAVMTVVVIFEFSVGATLGKGINRGIATLLGGTLGFAVHVLATFAGEKVECVILGSFVFLIAAMVTFIRFFPKLKARYDYGLVIFILTFSLICVSGYRDDEVLDMAQIRLSTVLIGGLVTIFICVFIRPIWAGEDLHILTATNIEKLSLFLEGFGNEYFQTTYEKDRDEKTLSLIEYKSVLNSKAIEDSLVNFAKWEPRHGHFRYRQPWDQYIKIGSLTRECANRIDVLNNYVNSEIQVGIHIAEACVKMSSECSYALRELAAGIKTMTCPLYADLHLVNAKLSAKKLKSFLTISLWPKKDHFDIIRIITVVSLLFEIVSCIVKIADSVHELAALSNFKIPDTITKNQKEQEEMVTSTTSVEESHNLGVMVE